MPKERIEMILADVERPGVDKLRSFLLSDSDFLTAPASIKNHLASPGGLVKHTLNVYDILMRINGAYNIPFSDEVIAIVAIGHDLCKVGCYKESNLLPTTAQLKYLTSLMLKVGLSVPEKLNKAYAGKLIDFMLNEYKDDKRIPKYVYEYQYIDWVPLGHGEKSLYVLQQFIKVDVVEATAIRWHMGAFDLNVNSVYQRLPYQNAVDIYPLVTMIQLADAEASHLLER